MNNLGEHKHIVCFGEILWDQLQSGSVPGGAPMNVAVRASSLGLRASVISKLGKDKAGRDLKKYLEEKQIETELLQTDENYSTGFVEVNLNKKGIATYNIKRPVAWDKIELTDQNKEAVRNSNAFIYGSLACRDKVSKNTLLTLLKLASFKIFDINLRPPFYDLDFIMKLIRKSDIIKLNDEELIILAKHIGSQTEDEKANIKLINNKLNVSNICVTRGENGAVFFCDNKFYEHPGYKVKVEDTIGSGDSFLAALTVKILNNTKPEESLQFACKVGALVAAEKGANAEINIEHL
ncbi:MAG: carbohydrate kinase [Marinilabiliales bacterium]|nr:MAG: carbohydrate kinase [Marinilabiliales bacterium]